MSLGSKYYLPKEKLNVWEWAAKNVDFSLVPNYETPFKSKYDPDLLPFWKEPAECITDFDIREVVVLKCSRAGATENVLINPIRYHVACDPMPILYLGAQQEATERFHKERISLGLRCSRETLAKYNAGTETGTVIALEDSQVVSGYPGSKSVAKGFGYGLVLGDEVSTWPDYAADMLRKRTDTYRFAHIVLVSSPDPQQKRSSDEDPIFLEFESGDQRYWFMPDPATGNLFKFVMGDDKTEYGLKWDPKAKRDDGSWDLNRVYDSAYYVTPDGTRIENADKKKIIASGHWVATNPNAAKSKRSYHLNAFYVPFRSGDFGSIACAFLQANAKGPDYLRVFVYEYLAEKFYSEKIILPDSAITNRIAKYRRGEIISEVEAYKKIYENLPHIVIGTVDVQKDWLYWCFRAWYLGGNSALVDYGFSEASDWSSVKERAIKYNTAKIFIDNSYTDRRVEVFEQCLGGVMQGAVPTFGRAKLADLFEAKARDPFEGSAKQGRYKMPMLTLNPDQCKNYLSRLINGQDGHSWVVFEDICSMYRNQMTSEKRIDSCWVKTGANHLWDCEYMSFGAANVLGYFTQIPMNFEMPVAAESKKVEEPKPNKKPEPARVSYGSPEDDSGWDDDF